LSNFALALKIRVCPEIIHCIEYIFYHSGFLSNLRLLWQQSLHWKFSLFWIYFFILDIKATCACPKNQSCPEVFHLIEYIFYHLGFLSNFRLPW